MAEQQLPVWNSKGLEPPANLQRDGWQPGVKPPAQYFDWLFNRAYKCLEELQSITEALETNKANGTDLTTLNNKVTQHLEETSSHFQYIEKKLASAGETSYPIGTSIFILGSGDDTSGYPYGYGQVLTIKPIQTTRTTQFFIANDVNKEWRRVYYNGAWTPWEQIASAKKPDEFNISYINAFSSDSTIGTSKYSKNQFEEVFVTIGCKKSGTSDDIAIGGAFIMTLPLGYRPSARHATSVIGYTASGTKIIVELVAFSDGTVAVYPTQTCAKVTGQLRFIATN